MKSQLRTDGVAASLRASRDTFSRRIYAVAQALLILCATSTLKAECSVESLKPRQVVSKSLISELSRGSFRQPVLLKFAEGSAVVLRDGAFAFEASEMKPDRLRGNDVSRQAIERDISRINALMQRNGLTPEPVFLEKREYYAQQRCSGEARSGRQLADVNLYFVLRSDGTKAPEVLEVLNSCDSVEFAMPQPSLAPPPNPDYSPPTWNFAAFQSYFAPAPSGIDVPYARQFTGGRGESVRGRHRRSGERIRHDAIDGSAEVVSAIWRRAGWRGQSHFRDEADQAGRHRVDRAAGSVKRNRPGRDDVEVAAGMGSLRQRFHRNSCRHRKNRDRDRWQRNRKPGRFSSNARPL